MRLFREGESVVCTEAGSLFEGAVGMVTGVEINVTLENGVDYGSFRPETLAHIETTYGLTSALEDVREELKRANRHGGFNSAHEGFAVLLEEVEELKAHVWMRQKERDLVEMRKEAIQVAAMAVKFVQMIDEGRGR